MKHIADELSSPPIEFSAEAIQEQLAQILASPAFDVSERLKDFLTFVVEETLAGRQKDLKAYTIATMVLRRGEDFDAGSDPIVRIEAAKLRKALERYYLLDGSTDQLRIRIPKGAYVPIFEQQPSSTTATAAEEKFPHLVVIPFDLLSHDADRDYLAVGITEEVSTTLSRYKNLRVIASGSARYLYEQGFSEREIGRKLGGRFLLQGSVQQHGGALKVSVKLIDTRSGTLLWSERFRRQLDIEDIFELQEEIARAVAAKVGGEFGIVASQIHEESRPKAPPSLTAYETLLKFYHYKNTIQADNFHPTLDLVEATLDREPEYGELWSALGNLYTDNYLLEFRPIEELPLEDAERYALKGVELAPEKQSTHMALAYLYLLRSDLGPYAEEARYAYHLNPNNAYYIAVYGYCELLAGHWEQGMPLLEEGCRLNPYHPGYFCIGCFLYHYAQHSYAEAYQAALKINLPGVFYVPLLQAAALGQLGQKADTQLELLVQLRPDFPGRAHELIARLIKAEGQVAHILQGLRKAGFRLEKSKKRGQLISFKKAHPVV